MRIYIIKGKPGKFILSKKLYAGHANNGIF